MSLGELQVAANAARRHGEQGRLAQVKWLFRCGPRRLRVRAREVVGEDAREVEIDDVRRVNQGYRWLRGA